MKDNEPMNMFFSPGDKIYGYCGGLFGRDDYDDKVCVMVSFNYAIFVNDEGYASALNRDSCITQERVDGWKTALEL